MKVKSIVVLILFMSIGLAQNYLLDPSQYSFHIKGNYTPFFAGIDAFDIETGYTLKGRTTINANYRQYTINSAVKKSINFIGMGIDYLLAKQNEFPFSVSFGTNYRFGLLGYIDPIEGTDIEFIQLNEFNLYSKLSRKFNIISEWAIIPSISAGIYMRDHTYPQDYDPINRYATSPFPNNIIYSLQTDLLFRSLYVFIRGNYYTYHLRSPFSISMRTTDFGIGILLNRKSK